MKRFVVALALVTAAMTAVLYAQSRPGFFSRVTIGSDITDASNALIRVTAASPESALTGSVGDMAIQVNGSADAVLWIKESGTATTTGWQSYGSVSVPVTAVQGGTGHTSYAVGDIISPNTTTTLSRIAAVAAGSYLRSAGTSTLPLWSTLILPNAATNTRVVFASAANTYGEDADFTFDTASNTTSLTGGYKERSRTTAMGEWTTPTFSAGDYTGGGSMTWTVAAGDVITAQYALIGKTIFISYVLQDTSVGGTLSTDLQLTIPGGFIAAKEVHTQGVRVSNAGAGEQGWISTNAASGTLLIRRESFGNWSAATNTTTIYLQMFFEVQ